MSKDKEKEATLEELFDEMEEILNQLESSDIGMEEAFQKYQAGMNLIKECNEKIDRVEKDVLLLSDDMTTEVFTHE